MHYFIDTEFIDDGNTLDLISIGLISADDREFYLINSECNFDKADDWVKANVLLQLPPRIGHIDSDRWKTRTAIRISLLRFLGWIPDVGFESGMEPQFWGEYSAYDWVVFCQLFGPMVDLPKGFPERCNDLRQWCDSLGNPELPEKPEAHHALKDARWNRQVWEHLYNFSSLIVTASFVPR